MFLLMRTDVIDAVTFAILVSTAVDLIDIGTLGVNKDRRVFRKHAVNKQIGQCS